MVFGDAGSATLISKGNCEIGFIINNNGAGFSDLIIPAGGFRKPYSDKTSREKIDVTKINIKKILPKYSCCK
jgi:3-oxoacyl-[acyl-carrier-protein] synthase-3